MSDLDLEQKPSRRLWVCAAVAALALHLGGAALALTNLRDADDAGDGLGANAAAFAVEMASPKVEDDGLPPGPDVEQSEANPQLSEQEAVVKETELPKGLPTESDDPDRLVSPNDSQKPKEENPEVAKAETHPTEETQAQEATSRQTLDEKAPEADQAKAPNRGIGKDRQKLTADWGRKISAYFELHKRYPVHKNKATTVKLAIVLNRRGNVVKVEVAESSGDPVFDDAAIAMVRRSDPVPVPPADLTADEFPFTLPVKFTKPK